MRRLFPILLVLFFATLAACSSKSSEDRCANVDCERGRCDDASGECVNFDSCVVDTQCLQGWTCDAGICIPSIPCADDAPCDRGVCVDGACVNAEVCSAAEECVVGYRCDPNRRCIEDGCALLDCDRGVCNPDTATCVNAGVCTVATQDTDCLTNHYCYGQVCEPADVICDDVECERGECDPQNAACVQPAQCEDDVNCLQGYFCSQGECVANECDQQMVNCPRGVCDENDGTCQNADDCDSVDDCLDGFVCVDDACVIAGDECQPPCPGTQVCTYDEDNLTAFCQEGPNCFAALDCLEDRVCSDGVCSSGGPCIDDTHEPNDIDAEAVAIAALSGNTAHGTICGADIDTFSFHTDDSPLFRGELVVDLAIYREDVGAGDLRVTIEHPDGTVDSVTTDLTTGVARFTAGVGVLDAGLFTIRVERGASVVPSGVGYALFVDLVDEQTVDACAQAEALGSEVVMGNTSSGATYLLSADCVDDNNTAGEDLYTFSVTEPSWVRVEVDPSGSADLAVAIRPRCEGHDALDCSNSASIGQIEVVAMVLPPGDYFVIVEGADPASGGMYDLTFTAEPVICLRSDATCLDEDTSQFCNGQGTGFEEEACSEGCDEGTGRCARLVGDVCFTAVNATNGYSETVDWGTLANDYDPGTNSCVVDNGGQQTSGPDVAYFVDLPPDHVLHVEQSLTFGDRGSIYVVSDCANLADSCVAGTNESTSIDEELVYFNESGANEQLWVIGDVEADSFGYGLGTMAIEVLPAICAPGSVQCNGADIAETCDELGANWNGVFCSFGCSAGLCQIVPNDNCAGPIDLATAGPVTARIDEYNPDFNPGFSSCVGRSSSGPDAIYQITPPAGQVALVEVTADFDVAMYAFTDCSDVFGSCVDGSDTSGSMFESVEFVGDGTTTYFIGVDGQFSASGMFTISATLQTPSCTPGTGLGCADANTLTYCTPLGIPAPYPCSTTCTAGACDEPVGQVCPDAILMGDGDSYSGTINVPDTINPGVGPSGACNFPSDAEPTGSDVIFAVDLVAGDWLFADYDINTTLAIMYALSDCADTDTCLARTLEGGQGTLVVEATTDQRVYFVLDRTTTSISSLTYTVDVDIRRQDCAPGSAPFCADTDLVEYCDNLGFTRQYLCNGTCTSGRCDTPRGGECIDPIPVVHGSVVTDDWSNGNNDVQPLHPLDGKCEMDDNFNPKGSDDIYVIDLLPGELLRARLTTNYGSAYHYILEDCFDTSTCVDNNYDGGPGDVYHYSQNGGPAYIIVDAASTFNSTSPYTLEIDVSTGAACRPGGSDCSASTLSTCDDGGAGLSSVVTCSAGCATLEHCEPDTGTDLCATAPLTTGVHVYGTWDNLTNDVEVSSSAANCTGTTGLGNDLVYAVSVGPPDIIHARLKSLGIETVQLYVAEDCADPNNTCEAGIRSNSDQLAEMYFAPTVFDTYYIVAEATASSSDEPFELEIEVLSPQCTTGDFQCAPSGQAMLECNAFGLWESYECTGGCANNQCGTPAGQACFDAIGVVDGSMFSGVYDTADNVNPGSGVVGACDFGFSSSAGADTIYRADLAAGDILQVEFTSSSSFGRAYILSDCYDHSSCVAHTSSGVSGSMQYAATVDETVFIVMDRTSSGTTTLTYDIMFDIVSPDCTPGDAPTCLDANTLQYCDEFGFLTPYSCGGATGTCTNGACDSPTADICIDASTASNGTHVTGDFLGTDDSTPPEGMIGGCDFPSGDSPDGVDHFYSVDLTAGQYLVASYTTSTSTAIAYILSDCADEFSCLATSAEGTDGHVAYQASGNETVTFVMDRTSSGASAIAWDADFYVAAPSCATGATQCSGNTLQWCDEWGIFEDFDCTTTCSAGACDDPTGTICADAVVMTDGSTVNGDFDGRNNTDLGGGTVGACDFGGDAQPGVDHHYRVDLTAGQTLTVDWTSTSSFAVAYLTTDCFDESVCLDSSAVGMGGQLTHTATQNESVWIVMDRTTAGAAGSLTYTIDVTIN